MFTPEQAKAWSLKNSKWIKVTEAEPFTGLLQDAKQVTKDVNGETKEVIRFFFLAPDGAGTKQWDTQNGTLIEKLATYMNKKIVLSCTGEGNKKRYEVALANAVNAADVNWEP